MVIMSRKMRWAGRIACIVEMRNAYKSLVQNVEGKRPLERPRRRLKDDIKMNLKETGLKNVD
jgi:hypothetical protein